jgi:hypothetical protein
MGAIFEDELDYWVSYELACFEGFKGIEERKCETR